MMSVQGGRITVNGIGITQAQINAEVQYHPAGSLPAAKQEAMKALVIRELLLQEALRLGQCDRHTAVKSPDEEIERLLASEIKLAEPDEESCRRYFEDNRQRFTTAPLFEVSHILFPALPGDDETRIRARQRAESALRLIHEIPERFDEIARRESSCSSAINGGHLGQITKGQTVPAFETALMAMKKGDISQAPVESEVGFHIIRVHERIDGQNLPYEAVKNWIAHYLREKNWRRAVGEYIQALASKAEIEGFELKAGDTPLLQ